MKDLISVIVPIYNVEGYVDKTISSICNQTYENLEIILVDDGSTDNSGKICDRFAQDDNRIKVIHKENEGVVSARKTGALSASGKYSMMVDGDDWIENTMVDYLYRLAVEYNVGIVTSGLYRDYGEDKDEYTDALEEGLYKEDDYCAVKDKIIFYNCETIYGIRPSVVAKLYDAKLLKDIYLDMETEIENGDDWAVIYPLIFNVKNFYVSHSVFYHYVLRNTSITNSVNNNYLLTMQKWYNHMLNHIDDIDDSEIKKQVDLGLVKLVLRGINYHMGLNEQVHLPSYMLPANIPAGKIALYGAGKVGSAYYSQLKKNTSYEVVAWVDQKWENDPDETKHVDYLAMCDFDVVLIAITYKRVADSIRKFLIDRYGILDNQIIWNEPIGVLDYYNW